MKNLSIVINNQNIQDRFMAFVQETDGHWLWGGSHNTSGHPIFTIGAKAFSARRVAWALLLKVDPSPRFVRFKCGMKSCVLPQHLELYQGNLKQQGRGQGRQRRTTWKKVASTLVFDSHDILLPPPPNASETWRLAYQKFHEEPSLLHWLWLCEAWPKQHEADPTPPWFVFWTEDQYNRKNYGMHKT